MIRRRQKWLCVIAVLGTVFLIIDAGTALSGATEGIDLCLRCIIPTLFPLIFLTGILSSSVDPNNAIFTCIEKALHLPTGSCPIWLLGCLGGYPVGARLISNRLQAGQLSEAEADDLLIFCNNPGPAFIFGIVGSLFTRPWIPFVLWAIQFMSSLFLGISLSDSPISMTKDPVPMNCTITDHLSRALTAIASICGWVVLFRILIRLMDKWILFLFPQSVRNILYGILELANGCAALQHIPREGARFIYSGGLLSFGGLCVGLQTASFLPRANYAKYYRGKLLQSAICILLCLMMQPWLFPTDERISVPSWLLIVIIGSGILLFISLYKKIVVEKKKRMVYNQEKAKKRCA